MATGSADATLKKLFHLVAAVHFWYGIYFDQKYVHPAKGHPLYGIMTTFGGKFRYLTILGAIWQATYYTLCVFNDFFGTNENHPKRPSKLRQLKDYVFATFSFPLAMTVAISFWALYAVDRELIFPKTIESFFPNWLNHVLHTNIVIFVFIELFLSFRQYPTRKSGITGLGVFLVGYLIWVHIIYYISGKWVYPILAVLNFPMRMLFMIFNGAFGISFYYVGEFLNNKIWVSELKSVKPSEKKHK